jgi:hypothetical protein
LDTPKRLSLIKLFLIAFVSLIAMVAAVGIMVHYGLWFHD